MTQPDSFYHSLRSEADLKELIRLRVQEDLYVEFKTKVDVRVPDLAIRDTWHFSRALSGFANSDGGVLLWGIKTNKHEQAYKPQPVSDAYDFQGRLKKSLLHSTQPPVDDVQIDVIPVDGSDGLGYIKCLVPASDRVPHRAMLADREYFRRSTEGFRRMEHFELEDMFGRRPRPPYRTAASP